MFAGTKGKTWRGISICKFNSFYFTHINNSQFISTQFRNYSQNLIENELVQENNNNIRKEIAPKYKGKKFRKQELFQINTEKHSNNEISALNSTDKSINIIPITKPKRKPPKYWFSLDNQKKFFSEFAERNNIKEPEDWYSISNQEIIKEGGSGLLAVYSSSLSRALKTVYPEFPWEFGSFKNVPQSYWRSLENQRKFLHFVEKKLNVKDVNEWEKIRLCDVYKYGGHRLISHYYSGDLAKYLRAMYPDIEWQDRLITKWQNKIDVKNWIKFVKGYFDIKEKKEWFRISKKQVGMLGGDGLTYSHGSLVNVLKFVYPEEDWTNPFVEDDVDDRLDRFQINNNNNNHNNTNGSDIDQL